MKIIHTSPNKIEKINDSGIFGDCLFFSANEYMMTQSDIVYVYSLEISEEKICAVYDLYDEEIIRNIAEVLEISEDDAERVLNSRDTVWEHGGGGEIDWWVQGKQGECAKRMGLRPPRVEMNKGMFISCPCLIVKMILCWIGSIMTDFVNINGE